MVIWDAKDGYVVRPRCEINVCFGTIEVGRREAEVVGEKDGMKAVHQSCGLDVGRRAPVVPYVVPVKVRARAAEVVELTDGRSRLVPLVRRPEILLLAIDLVEHDGSV